MERNPLEIADLSELHDSELQVVSMDRDNASLQLNFKKIDKTVRKFLFEDVLTYRINNIQYQNVVARILASNLASDFGDELEGIIRWTYSGLSNDLLISEENLTDHIKKSVRVIFSCFMSTHHGARKSASSREKVSLM